MSAVINHPSGPLSVRQAHAKSAAQPQAYPQPISDVEHTDMPPRQQDDEFREMMKAMMAQSQATTALAQAIAAKNGNGKTAGEKFKEWFPHIMGLLVIGFTVTRFDAVRETGTKASMELTQAKVEQVERRNSELWQLIEAYRLKTDILEKNLAVMQAELKRK